MFIPIKDLNPRRTVPITNTLLILANIAMFVYPLTLPTNNAAQAFVIAHATIPARFPAWLAGRVPFDTAFLPLLTSMFLHSSIPHIAGNMLFLWIFGDNVEDFFGHIGYLFFYLVCGIGAGILHVAFNLYSTVPALGASGAISGVMGAYFLLYPRSQVLTWLFFIFFVPLPAVVFLGVWFVMQFLSALGSGNSPMSMHGGVAWWAHVGGFVLGMLITMMFRSRRRAP